jgi:serine/threonine protein kinase
MLIKSLEHIHSKSIIHSDIKPENIIMDRLGRPHIADFGIASYYAKRNSHQNGGTLSYKAPEVILGLSHNYSVDYYAVAIVVYELFFKKRPHEEKTL